MTPDFEILIISSGFGGLRLAIRLEQAGLGSHVVLESGPDVGGTILRACDFFSLFVPPAYPTI